MSPHDSPSKTHDLRARLTDRIAGLAVYRRDADAIVPTPAGDLAAARDCIARLENELAHSQLWRGRAEGERNGLRRTEGQLRVELERVKTDALDRVAAAEALAAEAGVAPDDVLARVAADRAHWHRQIELRENEIATHRTTIAKLQREARR